MKLTPPLNTVNAYCKKVVILGFALFSFNALALPVVDQSQLSFNTGIPFGASERTNLPLAQSFTAGMDGLLSGIDVFSNGRTDGGSAVLDILTGDGLGGIVLGTLNGNVAANSYDSTISGYTVAFDLSSLNIDVSAGSLYSFVFRSVGGEFGQRGILASTSNPYAGGRLYNNPNFYGNTPSWDLNFRTHVDASVATVSEPATALLLVLGIAGLGLSRKRKIST